MASEEGKPDSVSESIPQCIGIDTATARGDQWPNNRFWIARPLEWQESRCTDWSTARSSQLDQFRRPRPAYVPDAGQEESWPTSDGYRWDLRGLMGKEELLPLSLQPVFTRCSGVDSLRSATPDDGKRLQGTSSTCSGPRSPFLSWTPVDRHHPASPRTPQPVLDFLAYIIDSTSVCWTHSLIR